MNMLVHKTQLILPPENTKLSICQKVREKIPFFRIKDQSIHQFFDGLVQMLFVYLLHTPGSALQNLFQSDTLGSLSPSSCAHHLRTSRQKGAQPIWSQNSLLWYWRENGVGFVTLFVDISWIRILAYIEYNFVLNIYTFMYSLNLCDVVIKQECSNIANDIFQMKRC